MIERLRDLARQASEQGFVTHTPFLSPAEQAEADIRLKKSQVRYRLTGGYPDAERRICLLLPEDLAADDSDPADFITALQLQLQSRSAQAGHRDYLGSLLGLGIRRDQLGDILVAGPGATVFVLAAMAGFISRSLTRIGAASLTIQPIALADVTIPERQGVQIRITAASLRLDKIAAAGFNIPRTDMAELIRSGQVQVNWVAEQRPDQLVPLGAVITLRGRGRIRLLREEGLSRKDRHILVLECY